MTLEADFQQQVIELLHVYGWRHLHVRRSIGRGGGGRKWQTTTNVKGWPDLFCWHEGQQRTLAAELKSETGKATDEQLEVLASLRAAGVEVHVWHPADLDRLPAILRPGS